MEEPGHHALEIQIPITLSFPGNVFHETLLMWNEIRAACNESDLRISYSGRSGPMHEPLKRRRECANHRPSSVMIAAYSPPLVCPA